MKFTSGTRNHRNTGFVVDQSIDHYKAAIEKSLMQVSITGRHGKTVRLPDGREVVEFINCSYLGLDLHPKVVQAYRSVDAQWGVNFCCARSRFSIEPQRVLEEELSELYKGRAVTFPSVTTTHISVMPLLASGVLIDERNPPKVRLIFDRFAHSSMQYLKPILAEEAAVDVIPHNSIEDLKLHILYARSRGETPVYVADGIYSMGGLCPISELLDLDLDFYIYLDDAHGTAICGENGEGPMLSRIGGRLPDRLFLTFCLSKGYGANGGGVLVSNTWRERLIRSYGQIYAFSAAMDYSVINACRAVLDLHKDGTVAQRQKELRERVSLFDELMGEPLPFSPIRMVMIGDEHEAIEKAEQMIDEGYFVSVVFFPIVPRGKAQLRICIAANHTPEQVYGLVGAIEKVVGRAAPLEEFEKVGS
jgi:8-amino-7-oxononanoate synthase